MRSGVGKVSPRSRASEVAEEFDRYQRLGLAVVGRGGQRQCIRISQGGQTTSKNEGEDIGRNQVVLGPICQPQEVGPDFTDSGYETREHHRFGSSLPVTWEDYSWQSSG